MTNPLPASPKSAQEFWNNDVELFADLGEVPEGRWGLG